MKRIEGPIAIAPKKRKMRTSHVSMKDRLGGRMEDQDITSWSCLRNAAEELSKEEL